MDPRTREPHEGGSVPLGGERLAQLVGRHPDTLEWADLLRLQGAGIDLTALEPPH